MVGNFYMLLLSHLFIIVITDIVIIIDMYCDVVCFYHWPDFMCLLFFYFLVIY